MMFATGRRLLVLGILGSLLSVSDPAEGAWWERPAATWYYKDDWKGLALTGSRAYRKTFQLDRPVESGWIVLWGDWGYRLGVCGKPVGENVDGALIDDYDLTAFLKGERKVTLLIEGSKVCAEGELVTRGGKRSPNAAENPVEAFGGAGQLDGVRKTPRYTSEGTCQPTLQSSLKASPGCVCDR